MSADFNDNDLSIDITSCPWCNDDKPEVIYIGGHGIEVLKCSECGFIFSKRILNETGLKKYWSCYESDLHLKDQKLNKDREKMYRIEYEYIRQYLHPGSRVLDIGCASGQFLDLFQRNGYSCYGVEFGEEAGRRAGEKYKVWIGEFPNMDIDEKFDLIIFRGVIQYLIQPKKYFEKAISLLNKNGLIFITSSPNSESLCFNLFKEKFRLPVDITDYYAFSQSLLSDYFINKGFVLWGEKYFYEETPYANVYEDIINVSKAIRMQQLGQEIDFVSPPFYGNMLTLVYKLLI